VVAFDQAGTDARLPAGAAAAASGAEVAARSDTVLLSLPDGTATLAVVDEIAAAPARRAGVVVDLSTIGPAAAAEAAGRLASVDVIYTDGPVSGGVAGARARTISLMFAGPRTTFEDHRPVLDAFARHVFHVGSRPGQGQAMKLVNNFLSAVALTATSEALTLGRTHGLDMATMLDVLNVSSGRNTATDDKFPTRVVTGTYDAGFRTRLMAKDVTLYRDDVVRAGTPAELGAVVAELWQRFAAAHPDSDFTEIWRYVAADRFDQ
jgi:3-hydroxyisobutyrate dehydrogenase-like beta-hydroxyacid dehydrogenase